jgi:peptidyl-prolyl cis-trans isomerase C
MTNSRAAAAVAVLLLFATAGIAVAAKKDEQPKDVQKSKAQDTSMVLVKIGDEAITVEDARKRLEEVPESARPNFETPEGRERLLSRMTEERIWLITALKNGVHERPDVKRMMEQQRRDLLIRMHLNEVMGARPAPSDSDASVYYEEHKQDFHTPASVSIRHIQTATEDAARQVLRRAREGEDWEDLVQEFSTDSLTRAMGGALGAATREGVFAVIGRQPALAESAFALGGGKIGGPYQTDRGWHVIQVDEVRPESTRPFETVRPMILRELNTKGSQEYYQRYLEEARRDLGVEPDSAAIKDFLSMKRDPRDLFKAAQEMGSPAARIAAYRALVEEHPDSDVSPQAQFMIGFVYSEELKDYEEAEKAFREMLKRYPDSELAPSAEWMVEHMRSEDAPPFDLSDVDTVPSEAGSQSASEKP